MTTPIQQTPHYDYAIGKNQTVSKAESYPTPATQQGPGGTTPTDNPELAQWYSEAYNYYNSVMNGSEPKPSEGEWSQFLQYMEWASGELGLSSSDWGDGIASPGQADPFGGMVGENGNVTYNQETAHVGFLGTSATYDVYSYEFILDVAPTSANVTVREAMDDSFVPPQKIYEVRVVDSVTGAEAIYKLHNVEDINKIAINTPGGLHVQDETGLVEVGQFQEGSLGGAGGNGAPKPVEVDGDTAFYDGVVGQSLDFQPPFGGIPFHDISGDASISVNASDKVHVSHGAPNDPNGYTVTVTDRDGNKTTFYTHDGFKLNLNAHPNNITFATGDGSKIDDFKAPGPVQGSSTSNGADGVPAGFENITINGGEATGGTAEVSDNTAEFLEMLGISASEVDESVLQELNLRSLPPSDALMKLLLEKDPALKLAWDKYQTNTSDEFLAGQVQKRLSELLMVAYGGGVSTTGEFPEGVDGEDPLVKAKAIFLDGYAWEIGDAFNLKRMDETSGGGDGSLGSDIPSNMRDMVTGFLFENKKWDELFNSEKQQVVDKFNEMKTQAKTDLDIDLKNPPSPPTAQFIRWILEKDPKAAELYSAAISDKDREAENHGQPLDAVLTHVADLLNKIYGQGFTAVLERNVIDFNGVSYDCFDEDYTDSSSPEGAMLWK